MSKSTRSELKKFKGELKNYRSIVDRNGRQLDHDPALDKQLEFWLESVRFLISELEIWDRLGNNAKCDETVHKLEKAIDNVHQLITQLLEKGDQ